MYESNCNFKKRCDLNWNSLKSTVDDGVRYCDTCERNVYLASGQEQFDKFATEGKCVAVHIQEFDFMGEPEEPEFQWHLSFPAQDIFGSKAQAIVEHFYREKSVHEIEQLYNGIEFVIQFGSDQQGANTLRKQLKKYFIESKVKAHEV